MPTYMKELTRAEFLDEIEKMPDTAYLTSHQAAAYLGMAMQTLANWRHKRIGPPYEGKGRFLRYQLRALKAFMATRASEIPGGNEQATNQGTITQE